MPTTTKKKAPERQAVIREVRSVWIDIDALHDGYAVWKGLDSDGSQRHYRSKAKPKAKVFVGRLSQLPPLPDARWGWDNADFEFEVADLEKAFARLAARKMSDGGGYGERVEICEELFIERLARYEYRFVAECGEATTKIRAARVRALIDAVRDLPVIKLT